MLLNRKIRIIKSKSPQNIEIRFKSSIYYYRLEFIEILTHTHTIKKVLQSTTAKNK